jgi:hypothetical protein
MRSKELALFRDEVQGVGRVQNTAYQEWQVVGEIMIGRHCIQDEVQGVGIVQNNSLP